MPLSGTTTDANGQLIGTGLAFDVFHEIQKKLGFLYTIIKPDVNQIGNVTHGAIKQLNNGVKAFPSKKPFSLICYPGSGSSRHVSTHAERVPEIRKIFQFTGRIRLGTANETTTCFSNGFRPSRTIRTKRN